MSTSADEFKASLEAKFSGLTIFQKFHSLHRLFEKLRLIHNAIGDVYMHRKTITQFQANYPQVYDVVKTELAPYVEGDYLNKDGWLFFEENMFNPRHDVIVSFILNVRSQLRTQVAEHDFEPIE